MKSVIPKYLRLMLIAAAICCSINTFAIGEKVIPDDIEGRNIQNVSDPVLKQHLKESNGAVKSCLGIALSRQCDAERVDNCIDVIEAVPKEWLPLQIAARYSRFPQRILHPRQSARQTG